MAGVEQLAGLVARLEAVAVKLESSGGAGSAGGDAGASVQVHNAISFNAITSVLFDRSLMTSVDQASSSLLICVTRLVVMWQQWVKCSG